MTDTTRPIWRIAAVSALFWLPLLSGVLSRVFKDSRWFGDYGAIACAAEKLLLGERIYDLHLSCPGMDNAMYIYHPAVAQAFAYPLSYLGRDGLMLAYAVVFILAVLALVWIMVGRAAAAPRRQRAWFGAFLVGSSIYWGNVAVLLHAFIGLAATALRRWPLVLVLAIAVAMVVKPLFVTFAAVFLLMPRPLLVRVGYAAAAALLGLAPSVWFVLQGGELATQWTNLVSQVVYVDRPGDAFLGWVSMFGADTNALGVKIGYVAFAGFTMAAAMLIAEGLELDIDSRALLGLSLGVLLNPRLMSQDFWLLGPGLLAVVAAVGVRSPALGDRLERAVLALCIVALVGNLADLADYLTKIVTLGLVLVLLFVAAWTANNRRNALAPLWRALIRGAPN